MSVDSLTRLRSEVRLLAESCRPHRQAAEIEQAVDEWALSHGLTTDPSRMLRARFGWLSANVLSEASIADAALFGRWFAWFFALDDLLDEGGGTASTVGRTYDELLGTLSSRRPASGPAGRALAELWQQTSDRAGPHWRTRFLTHLWQHRQGCVAETRNRCSGRIPGSREYVALRRKVNAIPLFDLPEVVLRSEIPDWLFRTPEWQTLFYGSNDVTAWCNDIASMDREAASGQSNNYVFVIAEERGLTPSQAIDVVQNLIAERCDEMQAACAAIPARCEAAMARPAATYACRAACGLLALPRAHLDWLLISPRYTAYEPSFVGT